MPLVVLGLNHKTAPIDVRERLSFSEERIKQGLKHLPEYDGILECVLLATCNRMEMYALVEDVEGSLPVMQDFIGRINGSSFEIGGHFFYYAEEECIRHLFRVASSLDSLVVGEGQILSQVKKAYSIARDAGSVSTALNMLFNRAIAVGKKVRTKTRIAYNAVSVSYAAVELAKRIFGELSKSSVLLLGAGETSELAARHLVDSGAKAIFVSNRNYERAAGLAQKFHGVAVPFDDFLEYALKADIVITSTGAPHYIIRTWEAAHLMANRQGRPIVFIDIAVPRDVEPEIKAMAGVQLYDIDSLEAVVESNTRDRIKEAWAAEELIRDELAETLVKFRHLAFRPTLSSLAEKAERIRQRELRRALNKLPDISPQELKVMENMSKMLVRKLLRDPIVNINEAAGSGKERYYLDAICRLFKLEEMGEGEFRDRKTCHRYAKQ